MGTFRNLMIILGMLFSALVIFFAIGMCFSGFRQKVNNVFHVVPESSYNTTLEQYEQQSVILTTLQSEKENLQTDKASLQTEKESLQTEKSNLQIQLARLQQSFDANEIEILNLESEIASLELDITNLETEIRDYENQITNLETEIINYETEIADLNNEIVTLQNRFTNISANINNATFEYKGDCVDVILPIMNNDNSISFYTYSNDCGFNLNYYGQSFIDAWNYTYRTYIDAIQYNVDNHIADFRLDTYEYYCITYSGSSSGANFNFNHYFFEDNFDYTFQFLLDGNVVDIDDVANTIVANKNYVAYRTTNYRLNELNKVTSLEIIYHLDEVV